MPLIMGILASAGAAAPPVAAGAYDLLETQTLGTAAASVTFTGLGSYSDYKHLQIRAVGRTDRNVASDNLLLRFNSDTGSNYARHQLEGNGSSVTSGAETSQTAIKTGRFSDQTAAANAFGAMVTDILDFSSSSKNTTVRTLTGADSGFDTIVLNSGFWNNTAAVTAITLLPQLGTNLVAGSRFSLYGIKGA